MPTVKGSRLKFSIWCDVSFALAYISLAIVICVVVDCPRTVQARDPDVVSVDHQNQISEHHQTRQDDEEVVNGRDAENLKLLKRFDMYSDFNSFPYDAINRILRDEDPESIHVEQHFRRRWRRLARPHKMSKRSAIFNLTEKWTNSSLVNIQTIHNTNSSYSTKSIELVNRGLNEFDLERLNISDVSQITLLNLTNNKLNDFSMATLLDSMVNLKQLDLASNHIQSFTLGISSNKVLENHIVEINLSCNNVSDFQVLIPNAKLRRLSLSNNRMSEIAPAMEIVKPNNLEVLDLSCNQIPELDRKLLANLTALKRLNLSWNKLRTIPKGSFDNLLHINTLVLSHNDISSVEYESFLVLPNLQHLDLSHNNIQADSIRALQGIPRLVSLSIAFNRNLGDSLQEFVASWSLKELDISGTGLCRIPAALAQSVRTLTASDNWFSIIRCGDLDSYPLLQYLDLSSSHIDEIEEDALGRLEILQTLFLDHNNLKRIPVSLPTSLENLFLHNNQIMEVQQQTFQQLYNLKSLDLSGNKLMYLPGLPLPKLLTLNLQSSELRGLSQSVVKTSPRLRDLLLEGNPIKCHDLLGIAEWVGLCRNDRIKEQRQDIKKKFLETHNYLEDFQKNQCLCEHAEVEHVETNRLNRQNCSTTKTLKGDSQNVKTKSSLKRLTKHPLFYTLLPGSESQNATSNSTKFLAITHVTGSEPTMTIPIQNTSRTIQSISNYQKIQNDANITTNSTEGGPVPNEPVLNLTVSMSQVNDAKIPMLPPQKIESPMSGQESRIHQDNYNIQQTSGILSKAANSKKQPETLSNITEILLTPMQKHPEANETKFQRLPKESIDLSTTSEDISQNFYQDNGEDLLTTINSNEIQTQISSTSELLYTEMSELSNKTITSKANKTEKTICLNESSNVNENGIIKLNDTISWTKQHKQDERDQNMKDKISVVYKIKDNSEKIFLKKTLKKLSPYTTTTKSKRYSASEGYARIKMNEYDTHLNVKISNQNAHKTVNKDKLHLSNQLKLSSYGFVATTPTTTITTARPTSASQKELDVESLTLNGRDTNSVHFTLNTPKDQPMNVLKEFGQISSRKNDEIDIENSAFISTLAARTNSPMMVDDDNQINIKLATINQIEEGGKSPTGTDNMVQTLHIYQLNTSGDGYSSRYDNNHSDNPDNINHNNTGVSNIHNSFNIGTATNRSKTQTSISITTNSSTSSSVSSHIAGGNDVGLPPEQLTGIRTSTGHPGLLIVIGVTFGMLLTLGLIHIYRCKNPWYHHNHRHRHLNHPLRNNSTQINDANYSVEDDCYTEIDQESQPSARRHFLPMELLSTSNLRYNNNNNNNNAINNNNNNLSNNYNRHYNIHNTNINTNQNIHTSTDNENLHPIGLW